MLAFTASAHPVRIGLFAAVVVLAAGLGLVCLLIPGFLPSWILLTLPVVGVGLTCAVLALLRAPDAGGELMLVWPVLFAGYFLSTTAAVSTAVAVVAMYTPVAVAFAGSRAWLLCLTVAATSAITLLVVTSLRRRIAQVLTAVRTEARTDGLTGALNRRAFDEAIVVETLRSVRDLRPLALMIIDIDLFKRLNDTAGHQAGDEALRRLGELLRAQVRRTDILARYGGEEFGILLPDCSSGDADDLADRICTAVREESRSWPWPLTVSIGVTTTPPYEPDPAALLTAADGALYDAKAFGRDTTRHAPHPNPPSALGWGARREDEPSAWW